MKQQQRFFSFILQIQLLVQLFFNFLCAFIHILYTSIFGSFYANCMFKTGFIVLCLLCGSMYICSSYPSSRPACAIISAATAQYKGEAFIGAILHLLEAADSEIMKPLHIIPSTTPLFFLNRSEDPDSWLPTLFATLSLSLKIRKRGLLGSKGTWSTAHRLSLKKKEKKKPIHWSNFFSLFNRISDSRH